MNNKNSTTPKHQVQQPKTKEQAQFQLSGFIKITDPKSGQILLQKRCE